MRILGVDPGSRLTGVGVIERQGSRLVYVHHAVLKSGDGAFAERLGSLFHQLRALIETYRPDTAAMEEVFVSKSTASALKLGQARGALVAACADAALEVAPYSPTAVKQAVVGFGRADKGQVQHMIRMLLKPPTPPPEDAADALAVAICHAHHAGAARMIEGAARGARP